MALNPVPWFVEEGAEHSADLARKIAHVMFGGQEGVLSMTDWVVKPRATPSGGVRIGPGVGAILNRAQGCANQLYIADSDDDTDVPVEQTQTDGKRSDLVVVEIANPYIPGEPYAIPADRKTGPYVIPRVLKGVPAGTTEVRQVWGQFGRLSAYALARVDIPVNTATIEAGMVKELRGVSNPLTGLGPAPGGVGYEKQWTEGSICTSGSRLLHTDTSFKRWPAEAGWTVNIPPWSNGVDVFCMFQPKASGDVWGDIRLMIDGGTGVSTSFDDNVYTAGGGGGQRTTLMVSGTYVIPASSRGKAADIHLEAKANVPSGTTLGDLTADAGCYVYIALNFKQHPSYE